MRLLFFRRHQWRRIHYAVAQIENAIEELRLRETVMTTKWKSPRIFELNWKYLLILIVGTAVKYYEEFNSDLKMTEDNFDVNVFYPAPDAALFQT